MTAHAPPMARAGRHLSDRYVLHHELTHTADAPTTVWRAEDLVLARPVAIRILGLTEDPAVAVANQSSFISAAMRSGRVTHPAVAAVFDAGVQSSTDDDQDSADTAYAVVSWIDGVSLQEVLRQGPLEQARAVEIVLRACDAVSALHEADITHGRLHPGNLFIGAEDTVSITDAVLAATMHGDSMAVEQDSISADTQALGWLLHCALTGYWPGPPSWAPALPPAPLDDANTTAEPRQLRGGITRELNSVVLRVSRSLIRSPAELKAALLTLVAPARSHRADGGAPGDRTPRWRTRKGRWIIRIAALVILASIGWTVGYFVGKVPNPPGSGAKALATPSASSSAPATSIPLTSVSAFDPFGDQSEDNSRVPLATDGNPQTGWTTETYQGGPKLGGKAGVGLLVDLGSAQVVKSVKLTLSEGGTDVELRAATGLTTPPSTDTAFRTVASQTSASGAIDLVPSAATTSRYWLVWLTSLPPVANGYQGAIMEMTFVPTTATP